MEIKKISQYVEQVLIQDERARNDDKWLIVQVLREMGFKIYIDYTEMKDMPSFESITRCRRKIQENGVLLPTEKIKQFRQEKQEQMSNINKWW